MLALGYTRIGGFGYALGQDPSAWYDTSSDVPPTGGLEDWDPGTGVPPTGGLEDWPARPVTPPPRPAPASPSEESSSAWPLVVATAILVPLVLL